MHAFSPNYDSTQIEVMADVAGFILGESILDQDVLTTEADAYVDIKADFTSISVTRSVGVDKGVLFRPEASSLSLTTRNLEHKNLFGRRIQFNSYGYRLFTGKIKDISVSVALDDDGNPEEAITLSCNDRLDEIANIQLTNWSAPSESVQARFARLGAVLDAVFSETVAVYASTDPGRVMAAITGFTGSLLDQFQNTADTAIARLWIDSYGQLTLDPDAQTTWLLNFSDEETK